ncbi:MAG: hypothetical protein KDE46_07660 [Caldilineaceae bacterium]|nr:hypothetical protein [Caldilineaceae bacterium]
MQYYKPVGDFFAGDCMPFFHDGVFHLYYLLDENHHKALNGLGGHQWAHASTRDLIHWQHHPLALAIDAEFEKSICTGSLFYHQGIYYAFYATRLANWHQHLSWATSHDAIHFEKQPPNPLASPPVGYSPLHFRDPHPFQDPETGLFHLLVTAMLEEPALAGRGGCLAQLTSPDLKQWTMQAPFLIPGYADAPECPDAFFWNGWYYLLFSNHLTAHYRMAQHPLGPWLCPPIDTLDGTLARVMKTAAFGPDRRLGVAWLGTRTDDKDDGKPQWGGHILFRELVQHEDGTLGSKFVPEMLAVDQRQPPLAWAEVGTGGINQADQLHLRAWQSLQALPVTNLPPNFYLRMRLHPQPGSVRFGLRLRGSGNFASGYDLTIHIPERMVRLHNEAIYAVNGLDQPFTLEAVVKDDIIDVCIDQRRCIVNRCPELQGDRLFVFAHNAEVYVDEIEIRPWKTAVG